MPLHRLGQLKKVDGALFELAGTLNGKFVILYLEEIKKERRFIVYEVTDEADLKAVLRIMERDEQPSSTKKSSDEIGLPELKKSTSGTIGLFD